MSENSPPYGTGTNSELPRAVPYAEQQIRALCLVAAANRWMAGATPAFRAGQTFTETVQDLAVKWRKFIAEGNWDA